MKRDLTDSFRLPCGLKVDGNGAEPRILLAAVFVAIAFLALLPAVHAENRKPIVASELAWDGTASIAFDEEALASLDWDLSLRGSISDGSGAGVTALKLAAWSRATHDDLPVVLSDESPNEFNLHGAFQVSSTWSELVIGDLAIVKDSGGRWIVLTMIDGPAESWTAFELEDTAIDHLGGSTTLSMAGHVVIASELARRLGVPDAEGVLIGTLWIDAVSVAAADRAVAARASPEAVEGSTAGVGPDVIVGDLPGVHRWGSEAGVTAYSVATTSCNIGDMSLAWFANTNQHPVIAQNLYRFKNGQFEQLGLSWLKHGFCALSENICRSERCLGPGGCNTSLAVGCSDPYDVGLNGGGQGRNLGPRHLVNAATGVFTFPLPPRPSCNDPSPTEIRQTCRRLQVRDIDLEPQLNAGARYFVEGHYVTADDAAAGNNDNNASYRRVTVSVPTPGVYQLNLADPTQRQKPGIQAWQDFDPGVQIRPVDVPGDGRFLLGCKASPLGAGWWHYEYAVQNLNSDRSAGSFAVPLPFNATIARIGFHDVDEHSGSPYSTTDWTAVDDVDGSSRRLVWSTTPHGTNVNANALRWGSLFNFRFDANAPPTTGPLELGLFKPGDPTFMAPLAAIPGGPIEIVASTPHDGAVDARQPSELKGGKPIGWDTFELTLNVLAGGLYGSDFAVEQSGGVNPPPEVIGVLPTGDMSVMLFLTGPISVEARTSILYLDSGSSITVGFLPADTNGDGHSGPEDAMNLVSWLVQRGEAMAAESSDIDRSGVFGPQDLVRLMDLLVGAEEYDTFNGAALSEP